MNQKDDSLIELKSTENKQQSEQEEVVKWDNVRQQLVKLQIRVEDNKITYYKDGETFHIGEQITQNPEIFNNIEQIKNLSWKGNYGLNNMKNGKWIIMWNSNILEKSGGYSTINLKLSYYQDGQKIGLWRDIIPNYWNLAQVFESGEYHNGVRIGQWNYIYNNNKINGGLYNEEGQKIGIWSDLSEGFWRDAQVIYKGEYNMDGRRIGKWDILFEQSHKNNEHKLIGGGSYYCNSGNKFGLWIEVWEGFRMNSEVIYCGEYDMLGKKMGRWDIILIDDKLVGYKLIDVSGGGSYDFNQGIKVGNWVELWENFMNHIQVTYNGEYNSKGIKTGRWDIKCYEQEQYKQIGGGWYDGDQGLKIGKWQELWHDRYYIHLHGEYNIKGKKMGRWNIESMGQNIGGGFYDSIYGNKTGRWVDIEKDFWRFKQVIYDGEYNIKGMKIGRWDTLYCQVEEKEYKLIGGGSYDSSSGVKIGSWVELWESFGYNLERTYIGEYNLQGDKVGIWVEMGLRNNQKLKETQYDN